MKHIEGLLDAEIIEKVASVVYRGITFPGYNKPIKSNKKDKKKMVLVKRGDRIKLVHYGHSGYSHNYSDKAKKSYLARSGGIRNKSGQLTKNDPFSPNYWARRDLWPKGKADGGSKYGRKEKTAMSKRRAAKKAEEDKKETSVRVTPFTAKAKHKDKKLKLTPVSAKARYKDKNIKVTPVSVKGESSKGEFSLNPFSFILKKKKKKKSAEKDDK